MSCLFNKFDDGQSPKKKIVSVTFNNAMFSLLDFFEVETDILS